MVVEGLEPVDGTHRGGKGTKQHASGRQATGPVNILVVTRLIQLEGPAAEKVNQTSPDGEHQDEAHHKEAGVEVGSLGEEQNVLGHLTMSGRIRRLWIHPDPGDLLGALHEEGHDDEGKHDQPQPVESAQNMLDLAAGYYGPASIEEPEDHEQKEQADLYGDPEGGSEEPAGECPGGIIGVVDQEKIQQRQNQAAYPSEQEP